MKIFRNHIVPRPARPVGRIDRRLLILGFATAAIAPIRAFAEGDGGGGDGGGGSSTPGTSVYDNVTGVQGGGGGGSQSSPSSQQNRRAGAGGRAAQRPSLPRPAVEDIRLSAPAVVALNRYNKKGSGYVAVRVVNQTATPLKFYAEWFDGQTHIEPLMQISPAGVFLIRARNVSVKIFAAPPSRVVRTDMPIGAQAGGSVLPSTYSPVLAPGHPGFEITAQ